MIHCSLCFKTKERPGDKNFFRVPKDEGIRKEWNKICRIDFKKKTAWICRDHFLPSHIIKCGKKRILTSNAVPSFSSPFVGNQEQKENQAQKDEVEEISLLKKPINIAPTKSPKNTALKNRKEKYKQELPNADNKDMLSQVPEKLVMELPVTKSIFRSGSTQTNTRLCGTVQASEFADEFRFNCFYCSDVFPLERWRDFTNHLTNKHFEKEKAFEISEFTSADHDYTPTNLPSSIPVEPIFETVGINANSLLPFLLEQEESKYNPLESVALSPNSYYTSDDKKSVFGSTDNSNNLTDCDNSIETKVLMNVDILNNCIEINSSSVTTSSGERNKFGTSKKSHQVSFLPHCYKKTKTKLSKQKIVIAKKTKFNIKKASSKTGLKRYLHRSNEREIKQQEGNVLKSGSIKISRMQTTEISFEYTPQVILDLLLDSMRNYPVLWEFSNEPFNEAFDKAIEELCKIINSQWSMNIDNLKMRRSINRILRFYCYLYPNENIENIHKFTYYYDKCALFLPSSANDIAYARCSHCYICYRNDFDLKRHLLKEQKHNLQWPYKCVQCKECFLESDEYEFHKHLEHYIEVFRCDPCKKKFIRRNVYNKHILTYHSKRHGETGKYECDQCDKICETIHSLRYHKVMHSGRKFKCHLCPKSYFVKASLSFHIKSHRKEYDFICEVCGKEFVRPNALKVHMKKHTGEKVTCSICNLKLRKSSLSRHLRLLHMTSDSTVSAKPKAKRVNNYRRLMRPKPFRRRKECEERTYNCKICEMPFEKYKLLAEHNKELHSDIPKWSCKMCDSEFRQKFNLRRHYRRKHKLHVIQAYKLVDEHEDLNVVLSIEPEYLDELAKNSRRNVTREYAKTPEIKTEFLNEEVSFEEEKIQSFAIHDELLQATDNITKEEIKIDYMNDFFTDILREQ